MKPYDQIQIDGRFYEVSCVALGGEKSDSVIGLTVEGLLHDPSVHGKTITEMFVPEIMLRTLMLHGLATLVPAPEA